MSTNNTPTPDTRRKLLRSIAASGSVAAVTAWHRPIVDAVILPTHAQTTGPVPAPVLATLSGTLTPASLSEGGLGTYTFTLSAALPSDLTFSLALSGTAIASDLIAFSDPITIQAGQTSFSPSFFPMGNDSLLEGPESAIISINPATLSMPGIAVPNPVVGTLTIVDEDLVTATVGFLTPSTTIGTGSTIAIQVQVSTPQIGNPFNVSISVSGSLTQDADFTLTGGNYNSATNMLTFPAGAPGAITQTIMLSSVAGTGDVTLTIGSTTPYNVASGGASSVTITIT